MKPRTVELHIEELVLHGFAPGDRYRIAEAVQAELTRLFTEQGVPSSLAASDEITRLDAGAFPVAENSKAAVVGAQVAQVVYGGLNR